MIKQPHTRIITCGDTSTECPERGDVSLILKPERVLTCPGGEIQFSAFLRTPQGEAAINVGLIFQSTNTAVLTVDPFTGLAQVVGAGSASVSVAWQQKMAFSNIVIVGSSGACCDNVSVAFEVVIDNSLSMADPLNEIYSKLDAALVIAKSLTDQIRIAKDFVGLSSFGTYLTEILPLAQQTLAESDYAQIGQSKSRTLLSEGLLGATYSFLGTTSTQQVIVLFSDGSNQPPLSDEDRDEVIGIAKRFKEAGGIIICVGLRARLGGFDLLQRIASAGYFINIYGQGNSVITNAATSLLSLLDYFCGAPDADLVYMYLYDTGATGLPLSAQLSDPLPDEPTDEQI